MTQREKDLVLEPSPIFAMRKILDYIEKERDVHIDIGRIPLNDKKTLNLFKKDEQKENSRHPSGCESDSFIHVRNDCIPGADGGHPLQDGGLHSRKGRKRAPHDW